VILAVGATGNIGRELVSRLVARGHDVRAVSRDPGGARAVLPSEVDVREVSALPSALDGVRALFLLQGLVDPAPLLADAARRGVERVVYVSSMVAAAYPESGIGRQIVAGERAVRDSGLGWTLVRPWEFQSNTLAWAASVRAEGVVRVASLGKPSPAVAPADIAAVSVRALVDDGHAGGVYPLTGPAELTVEDKVRVLGDVLGRPVSLVVAGAVPAHEDPVVRAALVPGVCDMDTPGVLPTVEEVTGRPAHAYRRWVSANAAAFSPA
jgi:uncharacterized protein YbjT (DUF2867 family)